MKNTCFLLVKRFYIAIKMTHPYYFYNNQYYMVLICRKTYKNYGFIARMINLFVRLYNRNYCYGNEHYDKLIDMRFFDREQEFEKLREIEELSHEVAQFTIITGRRRIGKTEMVKKFYENKTMLYFLLLVKRKLTYARYSLMRFA